VSYGANDEEDDIVQAQMAKEAEESEDEEARIWRTKVLVAALRHPATMRNQRQRSSSRTPDLFYGTRNARLR